MGKKMRKKWFELIIYLVLFLLIGTGTELHSSALEAASVTDATESDADFSYGSYDVKQSIVVLQAVYIGEDGYPNILGQENGFFIGTADSGFFFICGRACITFSEEQKMGIAANLGVDYNKFSISYQVIMEPDVRIGMSQVVESEQLGIVILKPDTSLGNVTSLRLGDNDYDNQVGDCLQILGKHGEEAGYCNEGTLVDWRTLEDTHFYLHDVVINNDNYGCPVLNENQEVVAINIYSDGTLNYALQIGEVRKLCELVGIQYNPPIQVDTQELEQLMQDYENLNPDRYTAESLELCQTYYETAQQYMQEVVENQIDYASQAKIDACADNLKNAIDGLNQKRVNIKLWLKILLIVSVLSFVGFVVVLVLCITQRNKFRKKLKLEEQKQITAEEALRISGRITPGEEKNLLSAGMPINRSLSIIEQNKEYKNPETSVLGNEDMISQRYSNTQIHNNAFLIRKRTGEEILINKNRFFVGKDEECVDYKIKYNANISRRHAVIRKISGNFYIQDMDTTNGTYVNGVRLRDQEEQMLQTGDIILMADEEFEFSK